MFSKSKLFFSLVAALTVVSCKRTTVVDAANYIKYVDNPDNGLIMTYTNDEKHLKITAQYKTPEYLAIKEIGTEAFQSDSILNLAAGFEGGYHFDFNVSSTELGYDAIKGKLAPKEYLERITYMSGAIRNDFKLVIGMDTLPCSVCHFERTYNISPDNILMLVFPYEKPLEKDLTLLYDDKIFGIGKVSLEFKNKNIKDTPKLL